MPFKGRFKVPFHVEDGVIYDADGAKVKLWGVNYYAPFNHNFYNIEELGKNHFAAIDEDIRHFKMLGVELIRMHLYDREITDKEGNVVENRNMQVFDYLVDQCEKAGIYLMLSPTVWWNTVKNQILQDRYYAYWFIDSQDAFGFSNYYSCDSLLWDPDAIKCQETYLEGLFTRRNSCSGKRLPEYSNIVVIELFNEPRYPEKWQLKEDLDIEKHGMMSATWSRGAQRLKLVKMWEEFSLETDEPDDDKRFSLFRAKIMKRYFDSQLPIVRRHFGRNVLNAQFSSYSGLPPEDLAETFEVAGFDAYTIGTYLNASEFGFDAENTDSANHLDLALKWFAPFEGKDFGRLAKISYEFDATGTQNGYPLAAIAAMYAKHNVQMASYFTYTPASVAAWNPGWLVHYLSLEHTPSRAAGFAAAGEIFKTRNPSDEIKFDVDRWHGEGFSLERKNDLVWFKSETVFRYSGSNDIDLGDAGKLELVSGIGDSKFASCNGNGMYSLEKIDAEHWRLELFPKQRYLTSPERGRQYRGMANRYVNCLREPPVSQLSEDPVQFKLKALKIDFAKDLNKGFEIRPDKTGCLSLKAGSFILKTRLA